MDDPGKDGPIREGSGMAVTGITGSGQRHFTSKRKIFLIAFWLFFLGGVGGVTFASGRNGNARLTGNSLRISGTITSCLKSDLSASALWADPCRGTS